MASTLDYSGTNAPADPLPAPTLDYSGTNAPADPLPAPTLDYSGTNAPAGPLPTPAVAPVATPSTPATDNDLWGNVRAGGYAALNSAALGLPDLLVKTFDTPAYQQMVSDRANKYRTANTVGDVVGTLGSLLIPGGAIAKGIGLGAKALGATKAGDALLDFSKLAGGPVGIKQGLAAAAEQAIPRSVIEGATTGDFDPGSLALNVGAGGALGGGLKLGKNLLGYLPQRLGEEIDEGAINQFLGTVFGSGPTGKALKQVISTKLGPQSRIAGFVNVKAGMADQLQNNGIRNSQQVEDQLSENGKAWQEIGSNVNSAVADGSMEKLGDIPQAMLDHPDVQDVIKMYGSDGEDAIQKIAGQISRTADDPANYFAKTREILNKNIQNGIKGTTDQVVTGDAAAAMKNYFDQAAMDISPNSPDIDVLKKIYPSFLAMGKAIALEKGRVPLAFTPGSDTYAKFATAMGDLSSAPGAVANSILGNMLNKGAMAVGNVLGAEGALKLRKILPRDANGVPLELSDLPASVQAGLASTGQALKTGLEKAPALLNQPDAIGASVTPTGTPAPGTPVGQLPGTGTPGTGTTAGLPAPNMSVLKPNLLNRLKTIYSTGPFSQYDDFPTFVQNVAARTNNFDPRYISNVLYSDPDAQKRYGKDILAAQQLSQLDLPGILNRSTVGGGIGDLLNTVNPLPNAKAGHDLQVNQLAAIANEGKPMDDKEMTAFRAQLGTIARLPEAQRVPQLLAVLKSSYGIDIPELQRQGVIGG